MVTAAAEPDAGFEVGMFAWRLNGAARISTGDVERYGVTADQLEIIKTRCTQWAATLREQPTTTPTTDAESATS